jgi:hypothetical protein
MKDIPHPQKGRRIPEGIISLGHGTFKLSPEMGISFRVDAYYLLIKKDGRYKWDHPFNDTRLWELYHWGCRKCPPIKDNKCTRCGKEFPEFKSIITAIRFQLFKDPEKMFFRYMGKEVTI